MMEKKKKAKEQNKNKKHSFIIAPLVIITGCIIRIILISNKVDDWVLKRPELVTSYDSFKSLKEGYFLFQRGLSAYDGDSFHQPPLLLATFGWIMENSSRISGDQYGRMMMPGIFILFDVVIGLVLRSIATNALHERDLASKNKDLVSITETYVIKNQMNEDIKPLHQTPQILSAQYLPDLVLFVYFLNPVTILTSLAPSAHVLTVLTMMSALYFSQTKNGILSTLFLALATYISMYPVCLVVPITLLLWKETPPEPVAYRYHTRIPWGLFAKVLLLLVIWLLLLFWASYVYLGSWEFIKDVYGWVFLCQDRTPNVGLYWYFFAETFPRFQGYFLLVFAAHPFLYLVPLTLRLGMYPLKMACILIAINLIFKAYPCVGDAAFMACLFLMFPSTLARMRNIFFYAVAGMFPLVLMPVMLYLWLVTGSGNVNFFYFQSLLYNFCLSMFVLQFIAASMRHRKALVSTVKKSEEVSADETNKLNKKEK